MTCLTDAERRLGFLALLLGGLAAGVGLLACFWAPVGGLLGGPGLLGVSGCLLMVALEPRQHRPFALPAVLALAAATLVSARGPAGLGETLVWGAVTLAVVVSQEGARRSVHGSWLRGGPPV